MAERPRRYRRLVYLKPAKTTEKDDKRRKTKEKEEEEETLSFQSLDSIDEVPSCQKPQILPLFVVGIDFGTTYSGWAYASRHDYLSDPLKVFTFHWQNGGNVMLKTNTCILFDEEGRLDGRYDSCGYDAYEKYVQLCSQKKQEKYYFFTDYKMILYENMEISSKSMIKADNGKEMNALTVFSETIRFFAEHFKKENAKLYDDVKDDEIHWVLTVPAIWNEKAKSFMREAAVQAGIPTNQLQIALEPEAAALYCKNLPIRIDERLFSVFRQNTTFMVVDIGGGTYDITVNRVTTDGLEELYMANGGNFGGNNVNDEFWNLLSTVYGSDTIEKIKKKFPDEYLDLDLDFEIKKKSLELNDTGLDMYFRVPVALKQIFTEGKSEEDIAKACNPENFHGAIEVDLKRGKLRIKRKVLVNLFRLPISELTQRLSELLSKPELYNLDAVLLVGGFADSPLLYEKVKASLKLENKNILILKPPDAVSAVVKGSVYFGHEPDVFSKRVCRYTYGIETHEPFDKTLDFETKLVLDDDGVKYCKSRFSKHVTIGDKIEVGTFTTGVIYLPMKDYQETVQFPVFVSMEQNPRYTDDRCTYLGSLSIDLSNLPREKEEIEVSILFGETELATVRAREIETGKEVHAELSFLG